MKSYRALALKEIKAQKVTFILILIAIVLSTMMTTAVGQSAGVLSAMQQQQAITLGGDRYATFVQMEQEQVTALQNDSRLSFVGEYITLGSVELNSSLTLGLNEYHEDIAAIHPSQARLKSGRLPEAPLEIALPEDVLHYLGFTGSLGDTIPLSLSKALRHGIEISSYDFTADFVLVGITESNYLNYTSGGVTGMVGAGTAQELLPDNYLYYNLDIRTADKSTFQETVNNLASSLDIHELDTFYNTPYLDALGIRYDASESEIGTSSQGFSLMLAAGFMVGLLLLLAAGLVIYNILKIAVTQRIKQYGTLRAIGGERGQLYFLVTAQVLLLCVIGIPVGLLLGVLSAKGILTAATGLLSPEIFLVQNTDELNRLIAENSSGKGIFLLVSALITLLFAFIAAIPAARYAAKVSPTVAMAGRSIRIKRRSRKAKKIRSFEAFYARLNLKRNRGRTAITILSLVMSITVFISLQRFTALLNTASSMENTRLGDYSIVNETMGFSPDTLSVIEQNEMVQSVATIQFSLYDLDENTKPIGIDIDFALQKGETFQVAGLNSAYLDAIFGERLSREDMERLKTGTGCIVRNPLPLSFNGTEIPRTEIKAGETITVAGVQIPVLTTVDGYDTYISIGNSGFTNGVQVIVSDQLYAKLTGKSEYNELRPILADGEKREAFDSVIEQLCREIPGTTYLSYEETDRQLAESFEQIRLLAWGLILFVGLIGLLNIINTVYTNIHTRVTEIGMQRAIGMSAGSLYKTFLWEGAYYGMIAAVIGSVAGYICTVFIDAAATDTIQLVAVPIIPIMEAAVVSIAACLLATCIPLKKIARMSIVESIETIE